MKIYTKTGDKGFTSLYDGNRIKKTNYVFNIIGELDELNSRLGVVCAYDTMNYIYEQIRLIQKKIQDINSILATFEKHNRKLPEITENDIQFLESKIDEFTNETPALTKFILPGVTVLDSHLHLCRTQTRKIERMLWKFNTKYYKIHLDDKEIENILNENIVKYFNRLSDYFFASARYICKKINKKDFIL